MSPESIVLAAHPNARPISLGIARVVITEGKGAQTSLGAGVNVPDAWRDAAEKLGK